MGASPPDEVNLLLRRGVRAWRRPAVASPDVCGGSDQLTHIRPSESSPPVRVGTAVRAGITVLGQIVDLSGIIEQELAVLERIGTADDTLDQNVHLFPSPGATPGCTGLLIADLQTTIIAGDAVLTRDHFEKGLVWEQAADTELAKSSLAEVNEIADMIVPGHDNIFASSVRFM